MLQLDYCFKGFVKRIEGPYRVLRIKQKPLKRNTARFHCEQKILDKEILNFLFEASRGQCFERFKCQEYDIINRLDKLH